MRLSTFLIFFASWAFTYECRSGEMVPEPPPSSEASAAAAIQKYPVLSPGKADFLFKELSADVNKYNAIYWTPTIKAGGGWLDTPADSFAGYFGAYVRPTWERSEHDLIVGFGALEEADDLNFELQGEFRYLSKFGIGGGFIDRVDSLPDAQFVKVSLRDDFYGWNYILTGQTQWVETKASLGGYAAIYNDALMGVGGYDGEQYRFTVGVLAPELGDTGIRPAGEVLRVDNSIGDLDGPKVVFVNATLGYQGKGFLSNPARLGRAMGPTGVEYGNPLGYLGATWNRRLDTWELGRIADFRGERVDFPDGTQFKRYEALAYPISFFGFSDSVLAGLFVGGAYEDRPSNLDSPGMIGGIHAKFFKRAVVSFAAERFWDFDETKYTAGLIFPF